MTHEGPALSSAASVSIGSPNLKLGLGWVHGDDTAFLGCFTSSLFELLAIITTRKQALGPPQKYRYGDEPVPILA